jgi:hypothetical protein
LTIDELKREALRLDVSSRADLARQLLESLDDLPESEVRSLWLEEAERRHVQMQVGDVIAVPVDEAFARVRAARA